MNAELKTAFMAGWEARNDSNLWPDESPMDDPEEKYQEYLKENVV